MKLFLAAIAVLFLQAEVASGQVFKVDYSNPGLIPAHWSLEIHPDGAGHFRTDRGNAPHNAQAGIEAPDINRDVQVTPHFAQHVFQVVARKSNFRGGCEGHLKVAFQGTKTFSYTGPQGQGSCEFNYSRDPEIQELGDELISVANTLLEGARLQTLLQHDRLGLDRETEILVESAADGRAQQIGSIRDILERLAGDDSVLERVRRRARALLAKSAD